MQKRKRVAVINMVLTLCLLVGCQRQTVESKDGSSVKDSAQSQSLTVFGASPERLAEEVKLKEKAKQEEEKVKKKLQELEKERSLSGTAKRILAEAEEAEEQGDKERYLAKIQEYRKLLNDEPIKRAAESWVLEGSVSRAAIARNEEKKQNQSQRRNPLNIKMVA